MTRNENMVGIVIPTLGTRIEFLMASLDSARENFPTSICLVGPKNFGLEGLLNSSADEMFIEDKGQGLPAAINHGMNSFRSDIEFVTWLGDDDLLARGSIQAGLDRLSADPKLNLVFGKCTYIDEAGNFLRTNKFGAFGVKVLAFGPCLVPQPGSLIRRSSFNAVGQLSTVYSCAFDLDLFLKLKKIGRVEYVPEIQSSFRWHSDSLSVRNRPISVREASEIRKSHLPIFLRTISELWEIPLRVITKFAARLI